MKKQLLLICLLLAITPLFAQTDKEKARKLLADAVRIMDDGKIDESIAMLDEARKLDPGNFVYDYETAFAYEMKKDYKNAIKYFRETLKNPGATDQCYQGLGNCYDESGDPDKAISAYDEGIAKFPNSGRLYMERGVVLTSQKKYDEAVKSWEKGISVNPTYPSNYYKLATLYAMSKDRIWTIFYGEMFMNLEWNTERTKTMSKTIYNAYQESIDISSDTSAKVDFAREMVITDATDLKNFKFPFDQVFGMDFLVGMTMGTGLSLKKEINIAYLHNARSGFIDWWYQQKRNKDYNNMILDYQKKVKEAGHFEAYNYWLLMSGNEDEFSTWYAKNEEKFKSFAEWFGKNGVEVGADKYFLRTNINK